MHVSRVDLERQLAVAEQELDAERMKNAKLEARLADLDRVNRVAMRRCAQTSVEVH